MNSWTPPAELGTTLPRHARTARTTIVLFTIMFFLIISIMISLIAAIFAPFEKISSLQQHGTEVSGVVTDKKITFSNGHKVYHINYRYKISAVSDDYESGSQAVPDTSYGSVRIGYSVPIVFNPIQPNMSMLNINNSLYSRDVTALFRTFLLEALIIIVVFGAPPILVFHNYLVDKI
jgi:Protein of unknown function (DUF3592)